MRMCNRVAKRAGMAFTMSPCCHNHPHLASTGCPLSLAVHQWDPWKKNVYSKINKHSWWWNSKSPLRKLSDSILCVNHLQVFPRLSERRLREDGFLSMAALRSVIFARVFLCSRGKLQELGVPMILVPGIQQGSLPGVLCVSWQETERVWKPTWQVRLYWKIAWFLSKYC